MYTALAGAVGALYGPLHGGANEVCVIGYFMRPLLKARRYYYSLFLHLYAVTGKNLYFISVELILETFFANFLS